MCMLAVGDILYVGFRAEPGYQVGIVFPMMCCTIYS